MALGEFEPTTGEIISTFDGSKTDVELLLDVNGIVGSKYAGRTRLADSDDVAAGRAAIVGDILFNDRQVTSIVEDTPDVEVRAIAEKYGIDALKAADIGINIGVRLDQVPEVINGVPGISNLPYRSRIIFEDGLQLDVGMPLLPCSGMGKRLADRFKETDGGSALRPNDFVKAAQVNVEQRAVTRRGVGLFVSGFRDEAGSIVLQTGDKFRLEPPARYDRPKMKG